MVSLTLIGDNDKTSHIVYLSHLFVYLHQLKKSEIKTNLNIGENSRNWDDTEFYKPFKWDYIFDAFLCYLSNIFIVVFCSFDQCDGLYCLLDGSVTLRVCIYKHLFLFENLLPVKPIMVWPNWVRRDQKQSYIVLLCITKQENSSVPKPTWQRYLIIERKCTQQVLLLTFFDLSAQKNKKISSPIVWGIPSLYLS